MTRDKKESWSNKIENCWLIVSVSLGFINLMLILLFWNLSGQVAKLDTLAISLTVLEIFLAVIAVCGFFVIRGAAMRQAEEEATIVAEKITKREVADITPPIVRRTVAEYMSLLEQKSGTVVDTTDNINAMMQALESGGDDD